MCEICQEVEVSDRSSVMGSTHLSWHAEDRFDSGSDQLLNNWGLEMTTVEIVQLAVAAACLIVYHIMIFGTRKGSWDTGAAAGMVVIATIPIVNAAVAAILIVMWAVRRFKK